MRERVSLQGVQYGPFLLWAPPVMKPSRRRTCSSRSLTKDGRASGCELLQYCNLQNNVVSALYEPGFQVYGGPAGPLAWSIRAEVANRRTAYHPNARRQCSGYEAHHPKECRQGTHADDEQHLATQHDVIQSGANLWDGRGTSRHPPPDRTLY